MTIVILTAPHDAHLPAVAQHLQQRGMPFMVFDNAQFPTGAELALTCSETGTLRHSLVVLGEHRLTLDMAEISAVWDRRPGAPVVDTRISDPPLRDYIQRECSYFLHDVWHTLPCFWVPGPPRLVQRASYKVTQLALAGQLGFEVPPTLVTNSPEEFVEFYRRHAGRIISKPFYYNTVYPSAETTKDFWGMYTQPVTIHDVRFAASLRFCPVIVQAYVPKRVELRITVVGDEIFACEIHSQVTHRTKHDWRNYDLAHTPHYVHDLPQEVRERCHRLVAALGLCYGAIDMILTPDGRYVFLEINPSGQFRWIEDITGLPISAAIAQLLAAHEGDAMASRETGTYAHTIARDLAADYPNRLRGDVGLPDSAVAGQRGD
jgi:MvdD-like protein with pre-ATP grasp domain